MIDIETAAAPEGATRHARSLATLIAATALAAALIAVLALRIDQRADRAFVAANRSAVQTSARALFRGTAHDAVGLASLRPEQLRGVGQAAIDTGGDLQQRRGAAQVAAAERLQAVVAGINPSVETAPLPAEAEDILFAADVDLDALVARQNAAITDLNQEGSRGDRASQALTVLALTGALLGLAAVIGRGRPATIVMSTAALLLVVAMAEGVSAAI